MRLPALARKIHKWIALIVAIQAVFWTVTGIYMTAIHIDIIHGDRLVKPVAAQPLGLEGLVELGRLAHLAPGLQTARLENQLGQPVYVVEADGGQALFDARTGAKLSPITMQQARARAVSMFAEDGRVVSTEFITKAPLEVQTRPVPLWRVEFAGAWRPTFYISPYTGELVTRRHDLWRWFDFAWMLHIMDYDDRQDVNNILLRVFTWMAVVTAASGAWLLLYSFRRKRRARQPVARAA